MTAHLTTYRLEAIREALRTGRKPVSYVFIGRDLLADLDLTTKERDEITDEFTRIVEHAMDVERTLYRLVQSLLLDKMFTLDHEAKLATPADEIATYVGDYWTRAQLFAVLVHAVELTQHICPSCEGFGGQEHDGEDVWGNPVGGWEPCLSCKGTGLTCERVTTRQRQDEKAATMFEGVVNVEGL